MTAPRILLCFLLVVAGCGDRDGPPEATAAGTDPRADSRTDPWENLELPVQDKLREARRDAARKPTARNLARFGRVLFAHGFEARAQVQFLAAAAAASPEEAFEPLYLAGVSAANSDPARAAQRIEKALELRDDYGPAYLRLAGVLEELGEDEHARRAFDRANELTPSSHAYTGIGRIEMRSRRLDAAVTALEEATRLDPGNGAAHEALARAYGLAGRPQDARRSAARALRHAAVRTYRDPFVESALREGVSSVLLIERANRAAGEGQYASALALVKQALRSRPDDVEAMVFTGRLRLRVGEPRVSLEIADGALALDPRHGGALALKGAAQLALGERESALHALQECLRVDPNNRAGLFWSAKAHARTDSKSAREHLETLLAVDPDNGDAHLLMADLIANEGDVAGAARYLRENLGK